MKFKNIFLIPISIVFIIISCYLYSNSNKALENSKKDMIEFTSSTIEDRKSYFYIDLVSLGSNDYYVIYKDSQPYVLKSKINLKKYSYDGSYVRVVGKTKVVNNDVKDSVIKMYNDFYHDQEGSKIDEASYDTLFGDYYLEVDDVINDLTVGSTTRELANFLLEIAIVLIAIFIIKSIVDYKNQIF